MITLNADSSTPQPTTVKEERVQIQFDNYSVDGSLNRFRAGEKYQSTASWGWLTPAQYQTLLGYFTSGSVAYANTTSDYTGGSLSFTGLVTFTESEYIQGGSLFRQLDAVIRQV